MTSAIMAVARKGTAPDPVTTGYSWGVFNWNRKSTDLASEPRNRLTPADDSFAADASFIFSSLYFLSAAIYSLQLTNYLYSSISFMKSQEYCV